MRCIEFSRSCLGLHRQCHAVCAPGGLAGFAVLTPYCNIPSQIRSLSKCALMFYVVSRKNFRFKHQKKRSILPLFIL